MQKRFFSSLALSLFLNLLIKPFSVLVIDVGVQRVLGNEIYGQYFVLLSLTLVFNIFLDLGINNFTTRYIAQNESHLNKHVSRVLYLRGFLFLLYTLLVFISAWLINLATEHYILLILLVLNQFLIQSVAFIRSLFSGLHLFKTDTLISVLDRALLIIIMGSALMFSVSSITIYNFVLAQTICYLITFSLALWLIRQQLKSILPVFDLLYIMDILKRSAPYALLVLLMMLYNRSDVVILKQLSTDGNFQAGIYAQGYRLLDAFYMLGMIFAGLLFPVFSRMIHQKNKDLMALVQVTGKLLIGGAIGIFFIVNYNGYYILQFIYGEKIDNDSITVFNYLMLAFAAMSFNFIFGTLLTAAGYLKSLNISAFFGVFLSVFSNIYFIPTMGALGCAISAFITQMFISIVLVIISARYLQVYFNIRSMFSFVLYTISLFSIKQLLEFRVPAYFSLWLDITLVLVFAFIFSIIDFNSLRRIWQLKEETQ